MSAITVFGIMVADMVARVENFPEIGETILGSELNVYLGGKGINQCVAAKRLGGDVEMIGCLGNDENGKMFIDLLEAENIKHDKVYIKDGIPTGVSQLQIDHTGQNKIVVIPSANHEFGINELEQVKNVFDCTEYAVFQLEMKYDVTEKAICLAYEKGVKVVLNPAPAQKLPMELLSIIDYITPNEVELGILADEDTSTKEGIKKAAEKLVSVRVKNVVATLGSQGAIIANKDGIRFIDGYVIKSPVDTVAAGDSFNGALVVRLQEGASLEEAVKFANAMGALTVQVKGAIPSLHTRSEVENFMSGFRPLS